MATQSILKNIDITDPNAAEILISAMEKAVKAAETSLSHNNIEYEDVTGDNIKNLLGAFIK